MSSSGHSAVFMEDTPVEEITAMNDTARGFVMSIRGMRTETGEELRSRISDEITPEMMFNKGTAPFPSLWSGMRKLLTDRGVTLHTHQRHRTIYTIANTIFVDKQENENAIELARRILNGTIYSPNNLRPNPEQSSEAQDTQKKMAHNVAMRLKDSDQKFSGDLAECWEDFKDEYEQICEDYNLTEEQRFKYLHNLLRKDAHRFFLDSVKPVAKSYSGAVELLEKEYNSVVRQTRVKNHLNGLRLSQFINDETDVASALAKVYRRILTMSRQVPMTHRGDAHKIEFMRRAVVGYSWAKEPLSRVATAGLKFQQLYAELEIAVQLERESNAAASLHATIPGGTSSNIHFTGQGRYVHRNGNNNNRKKNVNNSRQSSQRKRSCFNCGSDTHLIKQCPHPVNFSRAAAANIRTLKSNRTPNAVHLVLAHLCYELDEHDDNCENDNIDDADDDVNIFEQLLVVDDSKSNGGDNQDDDDIPIFSVQVQFEPTSEEFWGACIDSGAQRTVIGRKQARAYIRQVGDKKSMIRHHSNKAARFRFGDTNHQCDGVLLIHMPVADDLVVQFEAYVVPIDVPLLLGLDVLRKLDIVIRFGNGTLLNEEDGWILQLKQKMGHLYAEWPPAIYYTEQQLRTIHRHFYHPTTERLSNLIHNGAKEHVVPGLRKMLDHIRETCDVCQRMAKPPGTFRVAIPPGDCVFNRSVGMDLMKIEKRTVLHMVDRDTKFNAAVFLDKETSRDVWEAFLSHWVATYVGFPTEVILDQGPQFQSREFASLLMSAGINRKDAGVESHNSLGETERYHAFLRSVYDRARYEHPDMAPAMLLKLVVKACNDTAGPSGLAPTVLVFGVIPRLPIHPEDLPSQRARMAALHKARQRMSEITAKVRLSKALHTRVPGAADRIIEIGDKVLIYRDDPGKWVGPHRVIDIDKKSIHVDWDGRLIIMSADRCKRYTAEVVNGEDTSENIIDPGMSVINEDDRDARYGVEAEGNIWDVPAEDALFREFLVKILQTNDPRTREPDFVKAKQAEVDGLHKRGTWVKVEKSKIPKGSNVVGGRFIHTLKNHLTPEECAKVRYVAQGFADQLKKMLAHDVTALRPASIRLILSIASILSLRLFLHDVIQAYLQAKDKLTRSVYLQPKPEDRHLFGLLEDQLLRLVKPLYGLCDSGDYWNETIDEHLSKDLGMIRAKSDISLFFKFKNDRLIGITGNYVDDNVNAGDQEFQHETLTTLEKFDSKPRVFDNFSFFGTQIKTVGHCDFMLTQEHYAKAMAEIAKDADMSAFRRARAMLAWLLHSRPEYACVVNRSAQVTERSLTPKHIRDLNLAIRDARKNPQRGLRYQPLQLDSLHLRVYVDASFASNDDLTSQLGFISLLCDDSNRFHVLDYSSRKSRRTVRSIMGGELYAFTDAFDAVITVSNDLATAFQKKIPIRILTDSKQVFDVITRGKRPTEKRLAIDVVAAREAYRRFEIDRVGLVRGENNPADALSKLSNNGKLREVLDAGVDSTPVESWIMRTEDNSEAQDRTENRNSDDEKSGECEIQESQVDLLASR